MYQTIKVNRKEIKLTGKTMVISEHYEIVDESGVSLKCQDGTNWGHNSKSVANSLCNQLNSK